MLYVLGEAALRTALLAGVLQGIVSILWLRQNRLLLAAWTVVLATSLAMPLLLRSSPVRIPVDDAVSHALIEGATDLIPQAVAPETAADASLEPRVLPSAGAWLTTIYVVVGGGLGLRALLGTGLSIRILTRATPVCPEEALGMRVRHSREVTGPVTIARTIVLPADFEHWPSETRRAVLAHEQAHVARLDYALLVASQLNRAMFWFSPLSWWLHRRLVVLTELVSDDRAIEVTRDRVGYAEILLEMARRSGPTVRGPSMARLATLPLRIDRLLLDQVTSYRVSPAHWTAVTVGVAAVSLVVANLAPFVAPNAAEAGASLLDAPVGTPGPEASVGMESLLPKATETFFPTESPPAIAAPSVAEAARPSAASAEPAKPVVRPRLALQAVARSVPPPQNPKRLKVRKSDDGLPERPSGPNARQTGAGFAAAQSATQPSDRLDERDNFSRPGDTPVMPAVSEIDRLDGRTCLGTVVVAKTAFYQGGGMLEPNVKAGQVLPAKAQFFRKSDGSSWVRFGSFERPPLDVKVQPTRTGVTWTGEYGITYALQRSGVDHLVGLAAKIANDSAVVDLTCQKEGA